jgi:hypothetical protein
MAGLRCHIEGRARADYVAVKGRRGDAPSAHLWHIRLHRDHSVAAFHCHLSLASSRQRSAANHNIPRPLPRSNLSPPCTLHAHRLLSSPFACPLLALALLPLQLSNCLCKGALLLLPCMRRWTRLAVQGACMHQVCRKHLGGLRGSCVFVCVCACVCLRANACMREARRGGLAM